MWHTVSVGTPPPDWPSLPRCSVIHGQSEIESNIDD